MNKDFFSSAESRNLPLLSARLGKFFFGFGHKTLTSEMLVSSYPELSWAEIKQTHSAKIVESKHGETAPIDLLEADAHFSTDNNLALIVKSADCVPVLIACDSTEKPPAVCAIHAGWRGVSTDIVQISVRALLEKGYAPTRMTIAIGPHIRSPSFEVGLDVARDLKAAAKRAGISEMQSVIFPHSTSSEKRFVDLESIVRHQLMSLSIPQSAIINLPIDTLTSADWSSFRRDGVRAGRNLSFIAIKTS